MHALHQHVRGRGAGGHADAALAGHPGRVDLVGAVDQVGSTPSRSASSRRRLELELFGEPTTSTRSQSRGQFAHGVLAVLGGVADVVVLRSLHRRELRLERGDDVAGVVHRQRGLGGVGHVVGLVDLERRDVRRCPRPGRSCAPVARPSRCHWPIVPSTSGCPAWPISTMSRPARHWRATSRCTLVTSGQVASNTFRPRRSASLRTAWETPWALKITVAPSGTSSQLLDEHRAARFRSSTTKRLCTTSWRT